MIDLTAHLPDFLAELRARDRSPATLAQYGWHCRAFTRWLEREGRQLDRLALIAYRDHLQKTGKAPRTIGAWRCSLKAYFQWLGAVGHAAELPAVETIRAPRMNPPNRLIPTDAEMSGLFQAADRMPAHNLATRFLRARAMAILAVLAFTGLRRRELLDLTTADLIRSPNGPLLRVRRGKGGAYREVPLTDEASRALETWLEIRAAWMEGKAAEPEVQTALWPVSRTRRLDHYGLTNLVRRLVSAGGVTRPITPHCLRHWAASRWQATPGVSVATVSKLLGHSSVAVTFDYLHPDEQSQRRALDALPGLVLKPAARNAPRREQLPTRRARRR